MPKLPTLPVAKYSDAAKFLADKVAALDWAEPYFADAVRAIRNHECVLDSIIIAPLFQYQPTDQHLAMLVEAAYNRAMAHVLNRESQRLLQDARRAALDVAKARQDTVKACFGQGEALYQLNRQSAAAASSAIRAQKRVSRQRRQSAPSTSCYGPA